MGAGGQLNFTPCRRAEGKRNGRAHLVPLSLDHTPVTATHPKNKNKGAGGAEVGVGVLTIMRKSSRGHESKSQACNTPVRSAAERTEGGSYNDGLNKC